MKLSVSEEVYDEVHDAAVKILHLNYPDAFSKGNREKTITLNVKRKSPREMADHRRKLRIERNQWIIERWKILAAQTPDISDTRVAKLIDWELRQPEARERWSALSTKKIINYHSVREIISDYKLSKSRVI